MFRLRLPFICDRRPRVGMTNTFVLKCGNSPVIWFRPFTVHTLTSLMSCMDSVCHKKKISLFNPVEPIFRINMNKIQPKFQLTHPCWCVFTPYSFQSCTIPTRNVSSVNHMVARRDFHLLCFSRPPSTSGQTFPLRSYFLIVRCIFYVASFGVLKPNQL